MTREELIHWLETWHRDGVTAGEPSVDAVYREAAAMLRADGKRIVGMEKGRANTLLSLQADRDAVNSEPKQT